MKQKKSKKLSSLLMISLISLVPTMTYAEKLAGYLWAGTAFGAAAGSVLSGVATGLSARIMRSGRERLEYAREVRKGDHDKGIMTTNKDLLDDEGNDPSLTVKRLWIASSQESKGEVHEDIGGLGVLSGAAITVTLVPLSILSFYQAYKNFKDSN